MKRTSKDSHAVSAPPICVDCQRLHPAIYGKWGLYCDAFPDGIPDAIKHTRVDHHKPYAGDHGLQFLAKSLQAAADAARLIAEAHLRPVISPDAEAHNANWLRKQHEKETPTNGDIQ